MEAAKQPSELNPHTELLVEAILRQVAGWYEQAAKTEHTHVESTTYHTGTMPTLGYVAHIHSRPKIEKCKNQTIPET